MNDLTCYEKEYRHPISEGYYLHTLEVRSVWWGGWGGVKAGQGALIKTRENLTFDESLSAFLCGFFGVRSGVPLVIYSPFWGVWGSCLRGLQTLIYHVIYSILSNNFVISFVVQYLLCLYVLLARALCSLSLSQGLQVYILQQYLFCNIVSIHFIDIRFHSFNT